MGHPVSSATIVCISDAHYLFQGIIVDDDQTVVLPKESIVGPDVALETRLFRFYVIVSFQ